MTGEASALEELWSDVIKNIMIDAEMSHFAKGYKKKTMTG